MWYDLLDVFVNVLSVCVCVGESLACVLNVLYNKDGCVGPRQIDCRIQRTMSTQPASLVLGLMVDLLQPCKPPFEP